MVKQGKGGSIINVASFVAFMGCTVPQDAYTVSKGGMLSLTKSFAVQYGRYGIRCNAICPGPIETPLLRFLWTSEEARNLRLNRIPLGRFGEAKDIVYMALYLASDESSWTTGDWLVVDGGITASVVDAPAGISGAELAIAETGSVLLAENSLEARVVGMLTLTHFVLVREERLLPMLEDAGNLLQKLTVAGPDQRRYISLVTGPSRTAAI